MSEVDELMVEISREEYERLKRLETNMFPVSEPQILDTGPNGLIQVLGTYVSAELGAPKIHKLFDGGYCYESGLPVEKKKDLEIIPPGKDRDEAMYWFDTRLDESKTEKMGITVRPDLTLQFEDGTPVTSISEITQAIGSGMHQEWLIRCFMQQEAKKAKAPSETPEWMAKKEDKPSYRQPAAKKPKPKPKGRPAKAKPVPAAPPPLTDVVAQEAMVE